jgi:PAS domain S-box-containing protein
MPKRKAHRPDATPLRRAAGRPKKGRLTPQPDDDKKLFHERECHRLELQVQNEALIVANEMAEQAAARFTDLYEYSPLGYATLDAAGFIQTINAAAAKVVGDEKERLVGRRFGLFVAPADRPAFHEFLADALCRQGEECAAIEVAIAEGEGPTERLVTARLTARRMPGGSEILLCLEDVSERRRADEQLRGADQRKTEFLATLSHEMRNPLNAILNAAHVLENYPGTEAAGRAQGVVRRQADLLNRLVEDLLDVSRIERGKLVLYRSRIDLRELILRAAEDFRGVLEKRGVLFRVVVPDASVWAEADGDRLTQVLTNLLSNASKYTRSGDEVTLSLGVAGEAGEIRVKDTGAGIDAALLPHIFRPFVQAERTAARSVGGLGLGLAVVRALAELHGGTVRAESAGKGKGAEFVVHLPVRREGADAEGFQPAQPSPE